MTVQVEPEYAQCKFFDRNAHIRVMVENISGSSWFVGFFYVWICAICPDINMNAGN